MIERLSNGFVSLDANAKDMLEQKRLGEDGESISDHFLEVDQSSVATQETALSLRQSLGKGLLWALQLVEGVGEEQLKKHLG